MSALVASEIFRLFVNTLTPDDKYSRRNIADFLTNKFKRFYLKKKSHFCRIFGCISEMCMKFGTFLKKKKSILA